MPSDEIMDVASEWVERINNSSDPHRLQPELDAWLLEDPKHRMAYDAAQRQWAVVQKAVGFLKQGEPLSHEALLLEIETTRRAHQRNFVLRRAAMTCVLIALPVAIGLYTHQRVSNDAPAPWVPYVGQPGVPQKNLLRDGSELFLNHDSEVSVRFSAKEREIVLKRGELLIHVKHEDNRPLFVRSEDTFLEATGTEFSVRRDDKGDLTAVVSEGTISVGRAKNPTSPKVPSQMATVSAGQMAIISHGKVQVAAKEPEEIENELAWAHGKIFLHGTLAQAVAQFNEQNSTKLKVADPSIAELHVTGLFGVHDVLEFASSLRSRGIRFEVKKAAGADGDVIILSADKKQSVVSRGG